MRSKRKAIRVPLLILSLAAFLLFLSPAALAEIEDGVERLYKAADTGDTATAKKLIHEGVDVNAETGDGSYALNAAAVSNYHDLVRLLLSHKAAPNVQNSQGDMPLICATKYGGGDATTVKLLLEAGTDMKIADNQGSTALDYAREKGQAAALALLEQEE